MKIINIAAHVFISAICVHSQLSSAQIYAPETSNSVDDPRQLAQAEAVVSAHETQLDALGAGYGVKLKVQPWKHEFVDACPPFRNHFFVFYQRTDRPAVAFVAVFPRASGKVRIILLNQPSSVPFEFPSVRTNTVDIFNDVWREERRGNPSGMSGLSWAGLARCYAVMASERPIIDQSNAAMVATEIASSIDFALDPIASIIIGIKSSDPTVETNLVLTLNKDGYIARAMRVGTPHPKQIP